MKKKILLIALGIMTAACGGGNKAETKAASQNKEITVWHDLGENGNKWFNETFEEYKKENVGMKLNVISYPTDQLIQRSIASLNTNTAPDMIFTNYERIIKIESQTGKIKDIGDIVNKLKSDNVIQDSDLKISKYKEKTIIVPTQRVQMAMAVRKSWMDKVGGKYPETWEELLSLSEKFTKEDPDGNGKDDTYGVALQAAKPRDLVHMLDLFTFGSGIEHTVIDPQSNILINEENRKNITKEFVKMFNEYGYTPKDTINYSFTEMYQVIEGGKAGIFRMGDWNIKKWDDLLKADYVVGPWPKFKEGDTNNVVVGGMRGGAVPQNAPNLEAAQNFVAYLVSKNAQESSFKNVGSAIRGDLKIEGISEGQKFFLNPKYSLISYDFPEATNSSYIKAEEEFHKGLLNIITGKSEFEGQMKELEKKMAEIIKK